MPFLVKMTFALPEQVQPQRDADGAEKRDEWGKAKTERVPGHPTRPARVTDCNCWWEEVGLIHALEAEAGGAIVREVKWA